MYIPSMWASEERIDSLEGVATRDAEAISMTSVTRKHIQRLACITVLSDIMLTYHQSNNQQSRAS